MAYSKKQSSSNYINKLFLNQDCVLDAAFETFGGRWTTQVLFCIRVGANKFGLIKKKLPGISDHILGLRLKHLNDHRLIQKKEVKGEKVYVLNAEGRALIEILEQMAKWQSKR